MRLRQQQKIMHWPIFFIGIATLLFLPAISAQAKTYKFTVEASYWWNRLPVSLIYDGNNLKFISFLDNTILDENGVTASIVKEYREIEWNASQAIKFTKGSTVLAYVYFSGTDGSDTGREPFIKLEYIQLKDLRDHSESMAFTNEWDVYSSQLINKKVSQLSKSGNEYKFYAAYTELVNDIKSGKLNSQKSSSSGASISSSSQQSTASQENTYIRKNVVQYEAPTKFNYGGKNYKMYWTNPLKASDPKNIYVRYVYFKPDDFQDKNSSGEFRQPPLLTKLRKTDSGNTSTVVATVVEDKGGNPKTYDITLPPDVWQLLVDLYKGNLSLKRTEGTDFDKEMYKMLH